MIRRMNWPVGVEAKCLDAPSTDQLAQMACPLGLDAVELAVVGAVARARGQTSRATAPALALDLGLAVAGILARLQSQMGHLG